MCFPEIEKKHFHIFFDFEFISFSNRGVLSAAPCISHLATEPVPLRLVFSAQISGCNSKIKFVKFNMLCELQRWSELNGEGKNPYF